MIEYLKNLNREYKHNKEIKKDLEEYIKLNNRKSFDYNPKFKWFINQKHTSAGTVDVFYWMDVWAATKILEQKPDIHYDIGSSIRGFITSLQASKQETVIIDVRPMDIKLPYVSFIQADASELSSIPDNSVESLSSLECIAHPGLGRYGDKVNPESCFMTMENMRRIVKPGGHIYLSVPIGGEHLEFNAHRVFFAQTILDCFPGMELVDFCATYNSEIEVLDPQKDIHKYDDVYNTKSGRFGLFEFVKK